MSASHNSETPQLTPEEEEQNQLLWTLREICEQQKLICKELNYLMLKLSTPPRESTIAILAALIAPLTTNAQQVHLAIAGLTGNPSDLTSTPES